MRREDIARSIVDVVVAVPGVAGMHPGYGVEVATYFSGGKVTGVRMSGETVEVYIVADRSPFNAVAAEAGGAARRVLAAAGDRRPVDVVVADVAPQALDRRAASARQDVHAHG